MPKSKGRLSAAAFLLVGTAAGQRPDAFESPQMVSIRGYQDDAMEPFLSRDGTILFFNNLNEGPVNTDIHYAAKVDALTFEYKGRAGGVNTPALEGVPTMDRDGNFYFISPRDYDRTRSTIFTGRFHDGQVTGIRHVAGNLSRNKPLWFNMDVEVSADGRALYATDNSKPLFGSGIDASTIFVAVRTEQGSFLRDPKSDEIMKNVNAPNALQYAAGISADELTLYFTRVEAGKKAIGIYVATRTSKTAPFDVPRRIEAIQGFVEGPTVAPDGCAIYFHKKVDGRFHIFRAEKSGCQSTGVR